MNDEGICPTARRCSARHHPCSLAENDPAAQFSAKSLAFRHIGEPTIAKRTGTLQSRVYCQIGDCLKEADETLLVGVLLDENGSAPGWRRWLAKPMNWSRF